VSYDISFARQDASTDGALEEAPPDQEVWLRVVERATQLLGPVELFTENGCHEITHEQTGIQLSLWAQAAGITVPYWYSGHDARLVLQTIYALAIAVEEETGLVGYDRQVDQPVRQAAADPSNGVANFDMVASMVRRANRQD
jgi:hypothetical protein